MRPGCVSRGASGQQYSGPSAIEKAAGGAGREHGYLQRRPKPDVYGKTSSSSSTPATLRDLHFSAEGASPMVAWQRASRALKVAAACVSSTLPVGRHYTSPSSSMRDGSLWGRNPSSGLGGLMHDREGLAVDTEETGWAPANIVGKGPGAESLSFDAKRSSTKGPKAPSRQRECSISTSLVQMIFVERSASWSNDGRR